MLSASLNKTFPSFLILDQGAGLLGDESANVCVQAQGMAFRNMKGASSKVKEVKQRHSDDQYRDAYYDYQFE